MALTSNHKSGATPTPDHSVEGFGRQHLRRISNLRFFRETMTMEPKIIEKLFSSFTELEGAITKARQTFKTREFD
jgi:hypothetical protein